MQQQIIGPISPPQLFMAPNGSIRSVHSVPMLAAANALGHHHAHASPTWDGEPCPVHHLPHQHAAALPLAALYGHAAMPATALSLGPASVPPSVVSGVTTVRRARSVAEISNGGFSAPPATPRLNAKSFHGSVHRLQAHHPPLPGAPATLVRGLVPPGRMVLAENGAPSHLPMRDPKNRSPLPPKGDEVVEGGLDCCSGHFVVIWIILGIITFGLLLGIILRFTII